MTDRELLEAAARAAGIELIDYCTKVVVCYYNKQTKAPWNPLTDDRDALRLAVKRRMSIDFDDDGDVDVIDCIEDRAEWVSEHLGDDPGAATRRAIVRAAAAMVKE